MTLDKVRRVRKAVLPAGGLGTRFLPATKAQPKEMLPVVDKPMIQYVVEECLASGIEDVIIVTARGKNAIQEHFNLSPVLERALEERGQVTQAEMVRSISKMVGINYVLQKDALGLGHAILITESLIGEEPFAVLLPDVIFTGSRPVIRQLMDIYEAIGVGVIGAERVPRRMTELYGIIDGEAVAGRKRGTPLKVYDLIEKPTPEKAPSTLGIAGRYVLPPEIFNCLNRTTPGRGGEVQLTDGLRLLAKESGLFALVYEGRSYNVGDKLGFLKATVEIALQNAEFGEEFREYLRDLKL